MKRTAKSTKRQTIKMVAWNPARRIWEEVFPEDGVATDKMVAMYWSRDMEKFVTCPDIPVAQVYGEWLAQVR